jgi:ABC-2 type transport system ATP-binding protein
MAQTSGLAIRLRGLHKRFGAREALRGLDLDVPVGIVYGFLGPNGAGKTTTMRILVGLLHADVGSIELLGSMLEGPNRRAVSQIGSLIDGPTFYPYLSGRDNLRVLAATGLAPRPGRIDEVLELVDLADRAGDRYGSYSMGMRQRLGIAAALLNDPPLLLLDEPANGLDPAGIVAIRNLLRQLAADGHTVLVSSHILGEMQQLADEVAIINAGQLVTQGRLSTLLDDGDLVRVHVSEDALPHAAQALRIAHGANAVAPGADGLGPGWIEVSLPGGTAAEVNRTLAEAGIYADRLQPGDGLEHLFLTLTGGER